MALTDYKSFNDYLNDYSPEDRDVLQKIRDAVHLAVPEAAEVISYQMPAFKGNRVFFYFAAFKDHYSLFIPPMGVFQKFAKELEKYEISKATIKIPKSEPIPYELISKMALTASQEDKERFSK